MVTRFCQLLFLTCGLMGLSSPAVGSFSHDALTNYRANPTAAAAKQLRQRGPVILDHYTQRFAADLERRDPQAQRGLNLLCGQFDCPRAGLFWHSNLQTAKQAAARSNKPILSLRMLGRLDEELSCANSRFFRTLLYPDPRIQKILAERFILHWSSERPVPVATIDFGDGRVMRTTITGNSIHYVIDAQGQVISAIPGLFSPQKFLSRLEQGQRWFSESRQANGGTNLTKLARLHRQQLRAINKSWQQRRSLPGFVALPQLTAATNRAEPVPAVDAAALAMSKSVVELPIVESLDSQQGASLVPREFEDFVARQARTGVNGISLSKAARNLMAQKYRGGVLALNDRMPKLLLALATDDLRNRFLYERNISAWLSQKNYRMGELNELVYNRLFATPASDPWLGLYSPDVYSGLPEDGLIRPASAPNRAPNNAPMQQAARPSPGKR